MQIRKAQEIDFEGIYSLLCELENEELPLHEAQNTYRQNLSSGTVHYLVAEENSKIVAFGSMHIQRLLHHCGNAAELQEMIIADGCSGMGIGGQFIAQFRSIALQKGCKVFEVCCNRKRARAHHFYEKNGLTPTHYKFTQSL